MRFVRRASLVFSLVLIVAIVVGFVARSAELAGDRDANLSAAADLGGARLDAIVQAATVGAAAGGDSETTAQAVAATQPGIGVCVVGVGDPSCIGNGPMPDAAALDEAARSRTFVEQTDGVTSSISVYDGLMSIEAVGPRHSVLAVAPADIVDDTSDRLVKVTTLLPAGAAVGGFSDAQGLRQTSTMVPGVDGVYVVATGTTGIELPEEEFRFYLIIFTLAVLLLVLAGVTLIVEQRSLVERASFDTLTRLPNRGEFERRASEAIAGRNGDGVCLLLFDLNGFKQVNDTHGHLAGDEMLKIVGSRLRKAVRDGDVVARWGGDEFVVLMPGISTEEMGSRRALQLAEQVAGRARLEGVSDAVRVKVSVGVAIWPTHGDELDDLVVAADQAMYEAKREGVTCRVALAPVADPTLVSTII